jgi:hypothetical protein
MPASPVRDAKSKAMLDARVRAVSLAGAFLTRTGTDAII